MEEDTDEVVAEYGFYLSQDLADKLCLVQHPVRPKHRTLDDVTCLSARMKPKQGKLELDVSLDTQSPNYSQTKGEQIAINVEGDALARGPEVYMSGRMDKQTLETSPSGVDTSCYAIGLLQGNQLHVTPLESILHMRPSFAYLDDADVKSGATATAGDAPEEDEDEPKAVLPKFAKRESSEAKARRLASYEHLRKQRDEERWVKLQYHHPDDRFAAQERERLLSSAIDQLGGVAEQEDNFPSIDNAAYLEKLLPRMEEAESTKPDLPNNTLSMSELKKMNIPEQVRALLVNAKVMSFGQIMSLLPKGSDVGTVLRTLQQVALLVQGCWVVRSELLYPEGTQSALTGAPANALCRGRDYLLWRFTQVRHVLRKDITPIVKLPPEDVKLMLEQIARLKRQVTTGWEFLLPVDQEFLNKNPDVCQRQSVIWEAKFRQLQSQLKLPPADMKHAAEVSAAVAAGMSPTKRRRSYSRSNSVSFSDASDSDTGDVAGHRKRHGSGTGRGRHGTAGSVRIKKEVFSGDESTAANSFPALRYTPKVQLPSPTPAPDKSAAAENHVPPLFSPPMVAMDGSGDATIKTSNANPVLVQELTKFLQKQLSIHTLLRLSDVRRLITLELAQQPAGHVFGLGKIPDHVIEECVIAAGGRRLNTVTKLEQPFWVFFGNHSDPLVKVKELILTSFEEGGQFKKKALQTKIEEKLPDLQIKEATLRKVLKDFCDLRSPYYYLRLT